MKKLEIITEKITSWIGTPISILIHTIFFIGIFLLKFIGFNIDQILLILTTAVSLEAIYLAIFIQMSVNKTSQSLKGVEEDIDDIQEDVDNIEKDVDDIQEDVEDLGEDVKEISEDYKEEDEEDDEIIKSIKDIEKQITKLHHDILDIKRKNNNHKE